MHDSRRRRSGQPQPTRDERRIVRIWVEVVPRARRTRIDALGKDTLRVAVTAPPHEGLANAALIDALAAHFGVPRSRLRIVAGHRGRRKLIEVYG